MILKKIILNNIRSYNDQEIEFPQGSILLAGDIGTGKTSILLAIEFALFGLQPGQRGSSLLRNDSQEGGVKIEFEVDGQNILIERTLKRGKTISQNYCSIIIDGERQELAVSELKNRVLEILNYPKEFSKKQNILYKFTVYTPQEEMKQIILQDSETRINTLRHVFGIDKYKKILENISVLGVKLREEKRIKEALTSNFEQDKLDLVSKENELEAKNYNLVSVEKELFLKKEERKKIQDEKQEIFKKIEEKNKLQQEIEKTNIMISNKNESISNSKTSLSQLKLQIKELEDLRIDESKILDLEQKISLNKKEKEKYHQKILDNNSQINSLILKNEENRKLELKMSNLEICPTCLQNVDVIYRANVLNKIRSETVENNKRTEEFRQEKEKLNKKLEEIGAWISVDEKELTNLKILKIKYQEIQEKQKNLKENEKIIFSLEKDVEMLVKHLEILKKSVFDLKKFDNLFEEKQRKLEHSLNEEKTIEIKVAELKKEIDLFSIQIEDLKKELKRKKQIKNKLDYLNRLENWISKKFVPLVSSIEKNVMIKLKADFSRLFAKWFSMLVSDALTVRLSDDFTPIIEQQDYDIDYAHLSGGERTAIALAYRLALNQVINSVLSKIKTRDLVILDEPTDGFSEQQLDKMRDVLQELNTAQLILVSHEQKIESFVDNVFRFKKENGISKMQSENFK